MRSIFLHFPRPIFWPLASGGIGAWHSLQRAHGGDGETVFRHACKFGLEGIVSKQKDSPYRSGRSPDWLQDEDLARDLLSRESKKTFKSLPMKRSAIFCKNRDGRPI
jgi:bifunctional non-homologous end joining protein LigD